MNTVIGWGAVPDDIIGLIIKFLPVRYAIQLAMLSRTTRSLVSETGFLIKNARVVSYKDAVGILNSWRPPVSRRCVKCGKAVSRARDSYRYNVYICDCIEDIFIDAERIFILYLHRGECSKHSPVEGQQLTVTPCPVCKNECVGYQASIAS